MARRKQVRLTDVKDIRSILRLTHEQGLWVRAISERLKISKTTISTYLLRAREAGLTGWPLPPGLDDDGILQRRLFHRRGRPPQDMHEPDWGKTANELKRKGVTLTLLWQEYRERQLNSVRIEIDKIETEIKDWHRANEVSQRLATIPGIGPITASAIVAAVPDATLFKSSRQFAAWLGLTPKSHSSGGKERLVGISKQGNGYIRRLLVLGATAVTRFTRQGHGIKIWASQLLDRKPSRLVTVALANKLARIVWALLIRKQSYAATVA